jgi:hypothetical protein
MDTQPDTVFSEAINIRPPLLTPGGGVDVTAAADTAISVVDAARFGYLLYLQAVCLAASTTVGDWLLKDAMGGATLLTLSQPEAASTIGKEFCWPFPHPWKTAAKNGAFAIAPSVATMGTWRFYCNGFRSAL